MQVHQPSSQELNTPEYPGRGAVSTPAVLIQGVSDGSAIPDRAQALRIRRSELALMESLKRERDPQLLGKYLTEKSAEVGSWWWKSTKYSHAATENIVITTRRQRIKRQSLNKNSYKLLTAKERRAIERRGKEQ